MGEQPQMTPPSAEQRWLSEQLYRELLSRYLTSSFWLGLSVIVVYLTVSRVVLHTIFWPPVFIVGAAVVLMSISMIWNRRGYSRPAARLYFFTIFLALFGVMSYLGGPFSVLSMVILINLSLIALLEGRRGVLIATPLVIIGILALAYAMNKGVIHPLPLFIVASSGTLWATGWLLVSNILTELYVLLEFTRVMQMAWREAVVRGQALEEVSRRAEEIARAERELREREAARLERLRKLVDTYAVFMERLRLGDYDVRLDLPEDAEEAEDPVLQLGYQLNATAENWERSLARVRQARDHYLLTAWSRFLEEQRWQNATFRLHGEYVDRVEESEAMPSVERLAVRGGELYLPLRIGAISLGVLVLRRGEDRPWSEDEVETLQAIVAPLVQTIDNLRLVEESRNRAAREQLSSRIADRMRESLDLERVLQTAAQELGEAFGLREVVVQLAPARERSEEAAS